METEHSGISGSNGSSSCPATSPAAAASHSRSAQLPAADRRLAMREDVIDCDDDDEGDDEDDDHGDDADNADAIGIADHCNDSTDAPPPSTSPVRNGQPRSSTPATPTGAAPNKRKNFSPRCAERSSPLAEPAAALGCGGGGGVDDDDNSSGTASNHSESVHSHSSDHRRFNGDHVDRLVICEPNVAFEPHGRAIKTEADDRSCSQFDHEHDRDRHPVNGARAIDDDEDDAMSPPTLLAPPSASAATTTTSTAPLLPMLPQQRLEFACNAFTAVQELLHVYGLSISPADIVNAFRQQATAGAGAAGPGDDAVIGGECNNE